MLGFSYNGKHCEELQVHYIPKESQRGERESEYEVIDNAKSWFDGGDWYRSRVKPKVFELPCYYEDLTRKEVIDIIKWTDRRTAGYLTFDERPYARYYVHPTKVPEPKSYGWEYGMNRRYSGTFTLTFTAYDPFAELLVTTEEMAMPEALDELDLLPEAKMPGIDAKSATELLVYNPGTELGHSIIRFAGTTGSDDLIITNVNNGDQCVLKAGLESPENGYIELDSKTGRVMQITSTGKILDYSHHGKGYIHFEPNVLLNRGLSVTQTSGSRVLRSSSAFRPECLGAYIYIDSAWRYLGTYTSQNEMEMNTNASESKTSRTQIATMNYLTIEKAVDASITQLDVICKPEVR